jgi:hypothetical protein
VRSLNGVSAAEGVFGTWLTVVDYEQSLFGDLVFIRVGQYSIDGEFIRNRFNGSFENSVAISS